MRNIFLLIAIVLLSWSSLRAQDLHFSQTTETPLMINPANAGLGKLGYRGIMNYKNQWSSFGKAYNTFLVSFDGRMIEKDNGILSIGLVMYKDNSAAIYKSTGFSAMGAYDLFVNEHQGLSFGLGIGLNQLRFSLDEMQWGSQYDGSGYNGTLSGDAQESNFNETDGSIDLSSGIVWHYSKGSRTSFSNDNLRVNLGAAGYHLNEPIYEMSGISNQPNHRKWIVFGDAFVGINNKNVSILPSFALQLAGGSKELLLGTLFRYSIQEASKITGINNEIAFSLGGNLRLGDAINPMINLEYGGFGFGLSYDMNLSQIRQTTKGRGGFEFSLKYMFDRE